MPLSGAHQGSNSFAGTLNYSQSLSLFEYALNHVNGGVMTGVALAYFNAYDPTRLRVLY